MTTIIRRTAADGAPALPRVPIGIPGPTPTRRVSVMNFQGVHGDPITQMADVITGRVLNNGVGSAPVLRLLASGVPVMEFVNEPSASGSAGNPTLFDSVTIVPSRTLVAIGRVVAQPSNTEAAGDQQSMQIITGATNREQGMSIRREQSGTPSLQGYGGGSVGISTSPAAINGPLQFFAVTFNGASSSVVLDGETTTVSTTTPTTAANFILGYSKRAGGTLHLCEAIQYPVVLTANELKDLRAHMRAIYQF